MAGTRSRTASAGTVRRITLARGTRAPRRNEWTGDEITATRTARHLRTVPTGAGQTSAGYQWAKALPHVIRRLLEFQLHVRAASRESVAQDFTFGLEHRSRPERSCQDSSLIIFKTSRRLWNTADEHRSQPGEFGRPLRLPAFVGLGALIYPWPPRRRVYDGLDTSSGG